MQGKTTTTALTVAIGGFIGATVAIWLHRSFWGITLGFVVGGFSTYILCDLKGVIRAIPEAYKAAHGWRASKEKAIDAGWGAVLTLDAIFWTIAAGAVIANNGDDTPFSHTLLLLPIFTGIGVAAPLIVFILALFDGGEKPRSWDGTSDNRDIRKGAIVLFPPRVCFYTIPVLSFKLLIRIPAILKWLAIEVVGRFVLFCGRFIGHLFLLIHSEFRLLCVVNALIGVSVGCSTHNALIGGAVGGILWLVCEKVIAKRVLMPRGLIPVRR